MAKKQPHLLTCFIKDKIQVTTNLTSTIQLPDGDMVEAPLVLEGILLDHDDMFILLGQENSNSLELLAISSIVAMKQVLIEDEVMRDPGKPEMNEMN